VFESTRRLEEDVRGLIEAVRVAASGRYACVMEPGTIRYESPEPEGQPIATLRRLLELNGSAIFALPALMGDAAGEGPPEDPFDGWGHDELCLAFLNGKVAVVIACPDAEAGREAALKPLQILMDRLLRLQPAYRSEGRGFFLGRPKLDFVTIARHGE
jgi:hypothetical protein